MIVNLYNYTNTNMKNAYCSNVCVETKQTFTNVIDLQKYKQKQKKQKNQEDKYSWKETIIEVSADMIAGLFGLFWGIWAGIFIGGIVKVIIKGIIAFYRKEFYNIKSAEIDFVTGAFTGILFSM